MICERERLREQAMIRVTSNDDNANTPVPMRINLPSFCFEAGICQSVSRWVWGRISLTHQRRDNEANQAWRQTCGMKIVAIKGRPEDRWREDRSVGGSVSCKKQDVIIFCLYAGWVSGQTQSQAKTCHRGCVVTVTLCCCWESKAI